MKKAIALTLILCILMTAVLLCACSNDEGFSDSDNLLGKYTRSTKAEETYNYNDGSTEPPLDYVTFSNEVTDFSLRLFRNYHKSADGTYAFSPASTALQLGLIANGASGDSRDEIITALCKDLKIDSINRCFSYFKSRLEAVGGEEKDGKRQDYARIDTNFFIDDTSDIKSKFAQTDVDFYGCDLFRFMFDNGGVLKKVNNEFVNFGTENAFSSLDESQNLFSATAIDICDSWLNAYSEDDLEKGKFGNAETTYMLSNETYMHTDKAQAIVKYTAKTPLKFMAIIPNEGISLDDYIADFTNLEFSNLLESVDFTKNATAKLPEFSVKCDGTAKDITQTVQQSGLYSLFSDKAEFDNMTRSDDFMFDAMYELAPQISVSAGGIGRTNMIIGDGTANSSQLKKADVTVEFNRPFIFLVLDNESNIPIIAGAINN